MLKYSFAPDDYLFLAHVYGIQQTPPPNSPLHLFYAIFYPNLYIWSYLLPIPSNDDSRMLISVFNGFPAGTVGWLAGGDILHIP